MHKKKKISMAEVAKEAEIKRQSELEAAQQQTAQVMEELSGESISTTSVVEMEVKQEEVPPVQKEEVDSVSSILEHTAPTKQVVTKPTPKAAPSSTGVNKREFSDFLVKNEHGVGDTTLRISSDLNRSIKIIATLTDVPVSTIIPNIISAWLQDYAPDIKKLK